MTSSSSTSNAVAILTRASPFQRVNLSFDFPFYGHTLREVTVATGGKYTRRNWLARFMRYGFREEYKEVYSFPGQASFIPAISSTACSRPPSTSRRSWPTSSSAYPATPPSFTLIMVRRSFFFSSIQSYTQFFFFFLY